MKIYSDEAVTKTQLTSIDARQTQQIVVLRYAVAISFVLNLALTVGLHFL
jgi:hypothetical protein